MFADQKDDLFPFCYNQTLLANVFLGGSKQFCNSIAATNKMLSLKRFERLQNSITIQRVN